MDAQHDQMDSAAVAVVPPPAALAVLHEVSELEGAEMALVQSVVAVVERADDGTEAFDEANGVVINPDGVGGGGGEESPFPLLVRRRSRRKTAGSRQSERFE